MKKLIIAAVVVVGIGAFARLLASKCLNMDWEQRFAKLPDNAPPKWMFRNISEIHENTERILAKLEAKSSV